MKKPVKSFRTEFILKTFLYRQFKKHFYRIYLDDQRKNVTAGPKLYLMNHSSWWDGLLIFYLNQTVMKEDSYALMSEKGLEDFPFFGKIGAFAVDPSSPKELMKSLKLSQRLLQEGKSLWVFPQGKEEHIEKRPIMYMNGPAYLHERVDNLQIVQIAAYYTFRHDQRPELFIRISDRVAEQAIQSQERDDKTNTLRTMHEAMVDGVKENIIYNEFENYRVFFQGSKTASEWLQWFKSPLKARSKQ